MKERLDQKKLSEIKKLYARSLGLRQLGFLAIVVAALFVVILGILLLKSDADNGIAVAMIGILVIVYFCAVAYVFKRARSQLARIYFYFFSVMTLWEGVMMLLKGSIACVFLFLIGLAVLLPANTSALFGEDRYSHEQLKLARKKLRAGESFKDEDLPAVPKTGGWFEYTCLIIITIGLLLATLAQVTHGIMPTKS